MRNYWLQEIRIKDAVKLIEVLITDEFRGDIPDPQKWLSLIEDLVDAMYAGDIIILDGLFRYEIICQLDEFGLVDKLELIEKY